MRDTEDYPASDYLTFALEAKAEAAVEEDEEELRLLAWATMNAQISCAKSLLRLVELQTPMFVLVHPDALGSASKDYPFYPGQIIPQEEYDAWQKRKQEGKGNV